MPVPGKGSSEATAAAGVGLGRDELKSQIRCSSGRWQTLPAQRTEVSSGGAMTENGPGWRPREEKTSAMTLRRPVCSSLPVFR
eukprot:COSAG06_NODE_49037_length_328_cov_0.672489_1_plen_82_part_01